MTQILSPTQDTHFDQNNQFAGLDIALFFQRELRQLTSQHDYEEEDYRIALLGYTPKHLVEKILDPRRFFRIIRDDEKKVIGYFESRQDDETTELVNWIFIDESHRRQGLSKKLWEEFFIYCKSKGRTTILSSAKSDNLVSCQMHLSLGFSEIYSLMESMNGDIIFKKELSE